MAAPTDIATLFSVEGQVAVVTGGGTGIGLMIATALEHNGASVYIVGRRLDVLEKAARENNKYGKLMPLQGDITSRDSLLRMVHFVESQHGYIDLLVNNAGIARNLLPPHLPSPADSPSFNATPSIKSFQSALWDTGSPEGFAETFETNVTAVYYTTVAFLELLHHGNLRRGIYPATWSDQNSDPPLQSILKDEIDFSPSHPSPPSTPSSICPSLPYNSSSSNAFSSSSMRSHVITISSSGAFRVDSRVLSLSYTLAKSASTHLGRLLANILAEWGIRSNILAPGVFPSEMTNTGHLTPSLLAHNVPLARAGDIADMAGSILFLASRAGAYVNGAVWLVDGGRVGTVASSYQ